MQKPIEETIVEMTRELAELRGQSDPEIDARRDELYARLRLIGARRKVVPY